MSGGGVKPPTTGTLLLPNLLGVDDRMVKAGGAVHRHDVRYHVAVFEC